MPVFTGTSGADTLTGTDEADTLYGGGGDDVLNGGGGNDILYAGNRPEGFTGATVDTLNGGAGDDVAVWTMDTWITNFDGGSGFDTADYSAYNPSAFFFSQPLTFQLNADGEIEASAFIFQRGQSGYNQIIGSFTNIERIVTTLYGTVNLGAYTRTITIDGSAQADRITTGSGADTIRGGAGADTISAGSGRDLVQGGQGDDILDGGADIDTMDYSDATGPVRVDMGAGTSSGAAGVDRLANFERIVGSRYDDALIGGAGDDYLEGGRGSDTLTGGAGRDNFRFSVGDSIAGAFDNITDFTSGTDALTFVRSGIANNPIVLVRHGGGTLLFVSHPDQPQTVVALNSAVSGGDVLLAIDPPTLYVSVTMVGLEEADTQIGGRMSDLIYGLSGDDILIGGQGADALSGGAGADTFLYRDYFESVATYVSPNGPAGSNTRDPGFDNLFDFATGIDRIDLTTVGLNSLSIIRQDGSSFLFGGRADQTVPFQIVAAGRDINASDLFGYNGRVYMAGSAGADVLVGGTGQDGILGGDGPDTITGGRGADALGGGAGADIFRYTALTDSDASGYDNLFDFQTAVDKIDLTAFTFGFSAISIVRSGGSSFVFLNTLQGGSMQIVAAGRDINATDFLGGTNNFYLQGSNGADTLIGSSGGDTIIGGDGADIITGGGSGDTLYGEAGADVFRYTSIADSRHGARSLDRIQDFVSGADKIDLSSIRAGQGDVFGIAYLNGDAHLFVDVGGDGFNDMEIIVTGATLLSSDIIWASAAMPVEGVAKSTSNSADAPPSDDMTSISSALSGGLLPDPSTTLQPHHVQDWWL